VTWKATVAIIQDSDQLSELSQPLVRTPTPRKLHNTPSLSRPPSASLTRPPSAPSQPPSASPSQGDKPVTNKHPEPKLRHASLMDRRPTADSDGSTTNTFRLKNLLHRRISDVLVDAHNGHTTHISHDDTSRDTLSQRVAATRELIDIKQKVISTSAGSKTHPTEDTPEEVCHQADGETETNDECQAVVTKGRNIRRGTGQQLVTWRADVVVTLFVTIQLLMTTTLSLLLLTVCECTMIGSTVDDNNIVTVVVDSLWMHHDRINNNWSHKHQQMGQILPNFYWNLFVYWDTFRPIHNICEELECLQILLNVVMLSVFKYCIKRFYFLFWILKLL